MNKEAEVKKFFIVLIIMSMLSLFVGAKGSLAYGELNVEISDNYIGHSPQLEISINSPVSLKNGSSIEIEFDGAGTSGNANLAENITVNGKSPVKALVTGFDSIELVIPSDVNKGDSLAIIINQGVFINPGTEGFYKLILGLNGSEYYSYCHIVNNNNMITNISLKLLGNNGFEVRFFVGDSLLPLDFIYVRLSPILSQAIPSTITFGEVWVNGTLALQDPVITTHFEGTEKEEKVISIALRKEVKNDRAITIDFKGVNRDFKIPENISGDAFVRVWTSKAQTAVESNHIVYVYKSGTYLKTAINLSPTEPDGDNGFYISKPPVSVSVDSGSQIGNVETFVSIDGAQFESYKAPFTLSDGIHSLKYYSVGYSGKEAINESVQETFVKVDSTKPIIELKSPLTTNSRIYTLQANITEDNLKEVSVKMGSILFYPVGNIIKIPTVLFETNTPVTIIAVDYAGNKTEYDCTIELIQ